MGDWTPQDQGFKAWTYPPEWATDSISRVAAAGQVNLSQCYVQQAFTLSNMWWYNLSSGGTFNPGNFTGVYTLTGSLIVSSADQTGWGGSGMKAVPMPATPLAIGHYLLAFVCRNASTQPGLPTTSAKEAGITNIGLPSDQPRGGLADSNVSALPAQLSNIVGQRNCWWMALS